MKRQTSIRVFKGLYFYYSYIRKLQSARPLSTSQKNTISKTALYTSENCNQQIAIQKKKPHRKEKRKAGKERRKGIAQEARLEVIQGKNHK